VLKLCSIATYTLEVSSEENYVKKIKTIKTEKSITTSSSQVDKYLDLIGHQIFQGNYTEAVSNCETPVELPSTACAAAR